MSPTKLKALISLTSPTRPKLAMQQERLKCKQLDVEISKMKTKIEKVGKPVVKDLSEDLCKILSKVDNCKIPPFMKLFWEEQLKYINCSSSSSIKYHPMITKYCLAIASRSSAAYKDLWYDSIKRTGVIVLLNHSMLRDYKNYIRPERRFNHYVVKELTEKKK